MTEKSEVGGIRFGPGRRPRLRVVERVASEYQAASRIAIFELARRMETAWGAGDALAYAAVFTPDADYVLADGTHLRGREAIARFHRRLFDSVFLGSHLAHEGRAYVRFLADEVAIVHWLAAVILPGEPRAAACRRASQTVVALRSSEGWRLSALHATRHAPRELPTGWKLTLTLWMQRLRAYLARVLTRRRR